MFDSVNTDESIITQNEKGIVIREGIALQKCIRQHNDFTTARYNLTSIEQNIILLMLAKIKEEDPEFATYVISGKDIFFNQTKKSAAANLSLLKEGTKKLMKRTITIKSSRGNDVMTHFVSSCEYLDGNGSIEVSYDPKLKPFLINVKSNYTQFNLENVLRFTGKYTKRLYQLLSQYQDTGMLYLEIAEFVDMLQLNVEEDGKKKPVKEGEEIKIKKSWWELYGSIKQRVIAPAKAEINEAPSGFYIYDIKEKIGAKKKVIAITILFRKRDSQKLLPLIEIDLTLKERLKKLKLSPPQIEKITNNLEEAIIRQTCYEIETRNRASNLKAIENIGGFTWRVFQEKMGLL